MSVKPPFVFVKMVLSDDFAIRIAEIGQCVADDVRTITVSRDYDGNYCLEFPSFPEHPNIVRKTVNDLLAQASERIEHTTNFKTEADLKKVMLGQLAAAIESLGGEGGPADTLAKTDLDAILAKLNTVKLPAKPAATSELVPAFQNVIDGLSQSLMLFDRPNPAKSPEILTQVTNNLPSFVYYSNYGNLDSEIYLPHVVANSRRNDLGSKEAAKVRTLRILFEFVGLDPEEIAELGRDFVRGSQGNREPSSQEVEVIAKKKKEREVLLASSANRLTTQFRDFWKQGNYRFRFQADGDHFRIWVSDDLRPEEIELEGRSTGLQWFLSFFLVFLVESKGAHDECVLLLDEVGQSLHPLAQRDLSVFLESLARSNQIIYTSHSPFLVDPDHLDRVYSVYLNEVGKTVTSNDLRESERNSQQSRSAYAVHAALGLGASDAILPGCQIVLVEGPSDRMYLTAMKTLLIANRRLAPRRDLVFLSAGGARGIAAMATVFGNEDGVPPHAILDSDEAGRRAFQSLSDGYYQPFRPRLSAVKEFCGQDDSEIEDLIPFELLVKIAGRLLRTGGVAEDFEDFATSGSPIIPQIKRYTRKHGIAMTDDLKYRISREVKQKLLSGHRVSDATLGTWANLFNKLVDKTD